MKKDRMEVLSDGVIVIIITIMVFEIKVPNLSTDSIWLLFPLLQHIGVYAMSFLVLAVMWFNHHHIFMGVEHVNARIVWLNFLLLFCMSLIPLPTRTLGQNFYLISSHVFYGFILACNSIAYSLLQLEVNRSARQLTTDLRKKINLKNWSATILYGLSIPLAFLNIYLSLLIFIAIPAMYFIPNRKLRNE